MCNDGPTGTEFADSFVADEEIQLDPAPLVPRGRVPSFSWRPDMPNVAGRCGRRAASLGSCAALPCTLARAIAVSTGCVQEAPSRAEAFPTASQRPSRGSN